MLSLHFTLTESEEVPTLKAQCQSPVREVIPDPAMNPRPLKHKQVADQDLNRTTV